MDAGTVKVTGLQGKGCIQLEVKYEGGSSYWTECGGCFTTDSEVVLADWCPQTQKRRRRAIGDVDEVQAKYCQGSGDSTLCSDPITPEESKSNKEINGFSDTLATKQLTLFPTIKAISTPTFYL